MEQNKKKDLIVTLSVLLVVVFIVTGVILTHKKSSTASDNTVARTSLSSSSATDTTTPTPAATDTTTTTTPTTDTSTSSFKDGTYTATADYATPENTENIKVTVTLKDGIVTDTSAAASAISRESKEYATEFVQNYKSFVVGKSIASIKLSRVSGSSLTSQGFNDAISQIENQAKA
ncbi:MAG: hypothetical protein JWO47_395 [Candidatus Saccharibacteria bacterium]|nr:hypothetical protein [Candidatus Saccharibacteria bacterium]